LNEKALKNIDFLGLLVQEPWCFGRAWEGTVFAVWCW